MLHPQEDYFASSFGILAHRAITVQPGCQVLLIKVNIYILLFAVTTLLLYFTSDLTSYFSVLRSDGQGRQSVVLSVRSGRPYLAGVRAQGQPAGHDTFTHSTPA